MTRPAKLSALLTPKRRLTKAQRRITAIVETAMRPMAELPDLPAELKGRAYATEVYLRLTQLYSETAAEIVTAFDRDLLVNYCLVAEQVVELDALRADAFGMWRELEKRCTALRKRKKDSEASTMAGSAGYIFEQIVKLDARVDRKRATLHTWAQSLYLTPRARAGAAPPMKPAPVAKDEMEKILETIGV